MTAEIKEMEPVQRVFRKQLATVKRQSIFRRMLRRQEPSLFARCLAAHIGHATAKGMRS